MRKSTVVSVGAALAALWLTPSITQARKVAGKAAAAGGTAPAAVTSRAEVRLILASQKAMARRARLPVQLKPLSHQLTRPPFSAFKAFTVLKTLKFALARKRAVNAVLVGPYVLSVTLLNRIKTPKGKIRYRFQLKLTSKRKRRTRLLHKSRLLLDKGGTFFLAGPRYRAGTLILGITLK